MTDEQIQEIRNIMSQLIKTAEVGAVLFYGIFFIRDDRLRFKVYTALFIHIIARSMVIYQERMMTENQENTSKQISCETMTENQENTSNQTSCETCA